MNFDKGFCCKVTMGLFLAFSASAANANVNQGRDTDPVDALLLPPAPITSSYVVTLSAGAEQESGGSNQTFYLAPDIVKSFMANKSTHVITNAELFLGLQRFLIPGLNGQLGLDFGISNNAALAGTIWDDADPQFNNYTYRYQVRHSHVLVKGKFLLDFGIAISPWISGGVGVGFNNAYGFGTRTILFNALDAQNFSSHTTTTFTYTIGAGLEYAIDKNWQAGVGYEFADWGKSQLGTAQGQTLGGGLTSDHLYTNSILLNLTYLA